MARLTLVITQAHSLKEKRMVLRRIKDRALARLGVTINEVGAQDQWQRAELGFAITSGARPLALELVENVVRVVEAAAEGQLVGIARETIKFEAAETPVAAVDDRTGAGDKAAGQGDPAWIPMDWRDDLDR